MENKSKELSLIEKNPQEYINDYWIEIFQQIVNNEFGIAPINMEVCQLAVDNKIFTITIDK